MNPAMLMQFKQFMNNPQAMMSRMGVPAGIQSNPQAIIQHLMDTGRLSQADFTRLQQQEQQIQSMLK